MAARSQRLGQFQSKSQSGLKRPIWAVFSRRSRLRQARCVLLPIEQRRDPGFGRDLGPVRHQAVQMKRLGAGAHCVELSHRDCSFSWS